MRIRTTLRLLLVACGVTGQINKDPLAATENYVKLRKVAVPERLGRRDTTGGQGFLAANPQYPIADVTFGGTTIPMLVDTGSSDIWIVETGFDCVDKSSKSVDAKDCNIPKTIDHKPTGGYIANANLSITYGDHSFVKGPMGFEDVTVAGLPVKHQQIGIANVVSTGTGGYDNSYGGIMGIGYPSLTHMFDTTTNERLHYKPIMASLIEQNLASSLSIALDRGADQGGYLGFGGIPPVHTDGNWIDTPILKPIFKNSDGSTGEGKNNTFYYTEGRLVLLHSSDGSIPTAYNVTNDFKYSDFFRTVVDSGSYLTFVPSTLASHIMTAYNPPARRFSDDPWTYFAECTATPPFLGVQFNNNDTSGVLWFDNQDLIDQDAVQTVSGKKWCRTGVQEATGGNPSILGDTWLHSVVAVFDMGGSTMHFAQRPIY